MGDHSYLPSNWRDLSDDELLSLREILEQAEYKKGTKVRPWRKTARPKQLPPDDPGHMASWVHPDTGLVYRCEDARCQAGIVDKAWSTHLVMSGRGTGKTWQASNWLLEMALAHDNTYWAIGGPTYADIRSVCIEGTTGIKKAALPGDIVDYNRNNQELCLRNGSMIIGCSAEKPESPRGHNFSGGWVDELCAIEREEWFHDGLMPALRQGDNPKLLITTTPRRTRLIRELVRNAENPDFNIHVTRSATMENPFFSKIRLKELQTRYHGTRLYRQELLGELLDDTAGALFTLEMISAARIRKDELPANLTRVVVAIDPAMRSGSRSDASGIIVAAEDDQQHAYVLADRSVKGTPEQVMRAAVAAYYEFGADTICCESNQGGDYLDAALKAVDPMLGIRKVHAMRGKYIRAEPVAMLYEQCVAAGSLVETASGPVPVENVSAGDFVWTREGLRRVDWAGCSGIRETVIITTEDGHELTCTPDHPVFSAGRGFTHAADLIPGKDKLVTWDNSFAPAAARKSAARDTVAAHVLPRSDGRIGSPHENMSFTGASATTPMPKATGEVPGIRGTSFSTEPYGKPSAGQSLMDGMSITSTTTRETTTSATWPPSLSAIISVMSTETIPASTLKKPPLSSAVRNWTGGGNGNRSSTPVMNAVAGSIPGVPKSRPAPSPAMHVSGIARVESGPRTAVYDLSVQGQPEFFADGILVHNCRVHHCGPAADFQELEDQLQNITKDGDRNAIADDRADALVWAITELKGLTQGSYLTAYGLAKCEKCEAVLKRNSLVCPSCGDKREPAFDKDAYIRPEADRHWAETYAKTCEDCGAKYARNLLKCPKCRPSAGEYLAAVGVFTGNNPGWTRGAYKNVWHRGLI